MAAAALGVVSGPPAESRAAAQQARRIVSPSAQAAPDRASRARARVGAERAVDRRPAAPPARRRARAEPRSSREPLAQQLGEASRRAWPSASVTARRLQRPADRRRRRGPARSTCSRASRSSSAARALVDGLEMRRARRPRAGSAAAAPAEGVDGHDRRGRRGSSSTAREQPRARARAARRRRRAVERLQLGRQPASSAAWPSRPAARSIRVAISAAAALVKVRHRMPSGSAPAEQQPQHPIGQHAWSCRCRRWP